MFGRHKGNNEVKQYNVSQEDVSTLQKIAHAKWITEQTYIHTFNGFHKEQLTLMDNIVAKLGINPEQYDVDWTNVFKDGKVYLKKKVKAQPKPEVSEKDAKQELPAR